MSQNLISPIFRFSEKTGEVLQTDYCVIPQQFKQYEADL